jgi:hypothetical protein
MHARTSFGYINNSLILLLSYHADVVLAMIIFRIITITRGKNVIFSVKNVTYFYSCNFKCILFYSLPETRRERASLVSPRGEIAVAVSG